MEEEKRKAEEQYKQRIQLIKEEMEKKNRI